MFKFLEHPPKFIFFTGKGGVGKTSLSCATAIHLARQGRQVLLVSTDPASNVAQVFRQEIGSRITSVPAVPGLSAIEIDPKVAAEQYRERIVGPVRSTLPEIIVKSIEEQLSGACTTEIAAFDEFTALLTDPELVAACDHIVFDTAPTGHTIRLLKLPAAWNGFIENSPGGASCLGPLAGLEKQRQRYSEAVEALSNPDVTLLVLVARAQRTTLDEAARTSKELLSIGLSRQSLIINGLLPEGEAVHDPLAATIYRREQEALAMMSAELRALPFDEVPLKAFNMVGVEALSSLFSDEDEMPLPGDKLSDAEITLPQLTELVDEIAEAGHGLVMMMGKGGVGKTTLAAAVAVSLARRGLPVHLTTSDPAAHLAETLAGSLPDLEVSRIDPRAETERYRHDVLASRGKDLDDAGRAILEEDLRSPCTEEIAVFQAFSRIIREAGRKFVIMDTAPTGHTLLLLDATGAYHREVTRHADANMLLTTPLMMLQDPRRTRVMIVTLAETTPVLEAASLQEDLRRAGIEPWAWVVNNSLVATASTSPLLKERARHERAQLDVIRTQHASRVALVPILADEPIGVERLAVLAGRADALRHTKTRERSKVMSSSQDIKAAVKERYASAATAAMNQTPASCCSGGGCAPGQGLSDNAKDFISRDLYGDDQLDGLPLKAHLASLGCGNPTALAELHPGETVLDLGSGGGIDVLLSARRVGPTGYVYGIDMTDEMLALAEKNKAEAGVTNAEFRKGEIENIPLADATVDVIISNCVINLSADKDQVLREAFRVLKPAGRFAVSDVVIDGELGLPENVKSDLLAWSGCIAGALTTEEYRGKLAAAGFSDIDIEPVRRYRVAEMLDQGFGSLIARLSPDQREAVDGKIMSAFIRARKN